MTQVPGPASTSSPFQVRTALWGIFGNKDRTVANCQHQKRCPYIAQKLDYKNVLIVVPIKSGPTSLSLCGYKPKLYSVVSNLFIGFSHTHTHTHTHEIGKKCAITFGASLLNHT